ncbi:MAG: S9 family peptidase [Acidobacteriota bacterium]
MRKTTVVLLMGCLAVTLPLQVRRGEAATGNEQKLEPIDVFQLEWASDPQISPDGEKIVYVRNFIDIMSDQARSNLWIINFDGSGNRPLTTGNESDSSPRWSPDGTRLLYASTKEGGVELWLRWMDAGQTAKLTNLTRTPNSVYWSPDGDWIAFSMFVPETAEPFVKMPPKPRGAKWAEPAKVITKLQYRADGAGYLENGYSHLFVLPADGGTPRQITSGPYNHGGVLSWTADGKQLIFSANRHQGWEYDPADSEIYEVSLQDGEVTALTSRHGPDSAPVLSPDGSRVAYLGYDERYQGYQVTRLYVMNRDGNGSRPISSDLDRDVQGHTWSADGRGLYLQYDTEGNTRIAFISLDGEVQDLARDVGGLSLGRPYSGGQFSVSRDGRLAFTESRPDHPAEVAVAGGRKAAGRASGGSGTSAHRSPSPASVPEGRRLTHLNDDLLGYKKLGDVEETWYESSFDDRKIQGWIVKPPDFDASKKYPLILEIHGGPFANYGDRFSAEIQLYAAAGYVVLYTNPRGSTSYGEEFSNLIHHNYPGQDYDDLMSGVDAVLARGYVDEGQLFVTGGSGGGVLSAWIVGHTDRFRAAAVAKPVINWYSFVLTSDGPAFFYKYWFPGYPWDQPDHYMRRSPIAYVGNVTTPTMLLTGEIDYRTPISETEQFYEALKLRKVDAAMVRIPEASHGIASRPSYLIAKVAHILAWFERHREAEN